jgi:hypothetical protein
MLGSRRDEKRTTVPESFARAIEDETIETHVVGCIDAQDRRDSGGWTCPQRLERGCRI